jgi:hypothetical protein
MVNNIKPNERLIVLHANLVGGWTALVYSEWASGWQIWHAVEFFPTRDGFTFYEYNIWLYFKLLGQ